MKLLGSAARIAALWLVLLIAQMAGGMLFFQGLPAAPAAAALAKEGPLDAGLATLAISLVDAVVLAAVAGAMRLRGLKLGLTLAAVFFGVETGLSAIEAFVYGADLHLPAGALTANVAIGLLRSVVAGAAIALMWRGDARGEAPTLAGLVWKVPLIAVLYIVCYSAAGYGIAWQSAAVRAYYVHIAQHYDAGLMLLVQFGRALIWCGLAWLLARGLSRPAWRAALLTGVAFSLWMDLPLLFPAVMPWPVREAHLVEIGVSNFVFGALAALILLGGTSRAASSAVASTAAAPAR